MASGGAKPGFVNEWGGAIRRQRSKNGTAGGGRKSIGSELGTTANGELCRVRDASTADVVLMLSRVSQDGRYVDHSAARRPS